MKVLFVGGPLDGQRKELPIRWGDAYRVNDYGKALEAAFDADDDTRIYFTQVVYVACWRVGDVNILAPATTQPENMIQMLAERYTRHGEYTPKQIREMESLLEATVAVLQGWLTDAGNTVEMSELYSKISMHLERVKR